MLTKFKPNINETIGTRTPLQIWPLIIIIKFDTKTALT